MKVLALADLHIQYVNSLQIESAINAIKKKDPDIVLIAGDVFESNFIGNPYAELAKFEKKTICCFGNHEFAYSAPWIVKQHYQDLYEPDKYDVHYLDIVGNVRVNGVNFVGNVLWYDGSFKDVPEQSDTEINSHWLDHSIRDFDFKEENRKCVEQIKSSYWNDHKNILLTHTCPHKKLNLFADEGPNWPNMYSGCDLLEQFHKEGKHYFDWVICGHTHRYCTYEYHDQFCVNVGNNYMHNSSDDLKYFVFEVEE